MGVAVGLETVIVVDGSRAAVADTSKMVVGEDTVVETGIGVAGSKNLFEKIVGICERRDSSSEIHLVVVGCLMRLPSCGR